MLSENGMHEVGLQIRSILTWGTNMVRILAYSYIQTLHWLFSLYFGCKNLFWVLFAIFSSSLMHCHCCWGLWESGLLCLFVFHFFFFLHAIYIYLCIFWSAIHWVVPFYSCALICGVFSWQCMHAFLVLIHGGGTTSLFLYAHQNDIPINEYKLWFCL